MDASAFGLSRNPFQRSPELDEACLPNSMAALLSQLQDGLRSPQGVSVLVAEGGCGKSMAASVFARRLGAAAQTVLLTNPTSSVQAIARDAVTLLGGAGSAFPEEDGGWVEALMADAHRRARAGKATVLLLDNAERLSPQTLEDLAELFDEDEPAQLHLFLFGRPRLLDRMHAGPEKALHAHLLQVGRIEPLGLRECLRYLERRVAMSGGELASLFDEKAIEELIRVSEGRVVHLEQNALAALERATRRSALRVTAEDVRPVTGSTANQEESRMPTRQQPLRFDSAQRSDDDGGWQAGDELEDEEDGWGSAEEESSEDWQAGEDGGSEEDELTGEEEILDEDDLSWETSASLPEDDEDFAAAEDGFAEVPGPAVQSGRRRFAGRAILSMAACLCLVWAANRMPEPSAETSRGRDARPVAERLTSRPEEILRLARSARDADADAHLEAWRKAPREDGGVVAAANQPRAAASESGEVASAGSAPTSSQPTAMGPDPLPAKAAPASVGERGASAAPASPSGPIATVSKPSSAVTQKASAKVAPKVASAKARAASPVFTVQLGAFKARSNAEQFATRLRGKPTRILQEGGLYRVMSGSFASKREATIHEASLRRAGFTTYVRTAVF
jgi:type II secretory pathway predicted ATPase ExeA/cell division protein FtsN